MINIKKLKTYIEGVREDCSCIGEQEGQQVHIIFS